MLCEDLVLILKMRVKMVNKEWEKQRMGLVLWVYLLANINLAGLPRWWSGKEPACQCRRHRRCGFNPWVWKIHWSRKWHATPVFLPGKFHEQRSLAGYSPWDRRVRHDWAHIPWYKWTTVGLSIHSLKDTRYYQFWTISNNAVKNNCRQVFVWT